MAGEGLQHGERIGKIGRVTLPATAGVSVEGLHYLMVTGCVDRARLRMTDMVEDRRIPADAEEIEQRANLRRGVGEPAIDPSIVQGDGAWGNSASARFGTALGGENAMPLSPGCGTGSAPLGSICRPSSR